MAKGTKSSKNKIIQFDFTPKQMDLLKEMVDGFDLESMAQTIKGLIRLGSVLLMYYKDGFREIQLKRGDESISIPPIDALLS